MKGGMEPSKKLEAKREEASKLDPGLDQLAKNLASNSALTQGAAKSLIENWQNALFVGLFIVIGYVFYERYQVTVRDRAAEGTQKLENIARQFSDYQKILGAGEGTQTTTTKEIPAELRDNTEVVMSTQSDNFVGRSAALYRAVAEMESGHPERAEEFIKKGQFNILRGVKAPLSDADIKKSQLIDELASLVEARRLLALGAPRSEAFDVLTSLAYAGRFNNVEAVVTLLRITTPEERDGAVATAKQFMLSRPDAKEELMNALREDNFDVSIFETPKS